LHGIPLLFFDTNVMIDADEFVKSVFKASETPDYPRAVVCDFIEGEVQNLKKGKLLQELKLPGYFGYSFETSYNSKEEARHSIEDMPSSEMVEAVLVEYDRKLDPSGMQAKTKDAKRASNSKSKFVDFSLLTVATISAYRRKRQAVVISRDRWIKLSCNALHDQFKLPIYSYDQWNFSMDEVLARANHSRDA
jgi:hypothetical protein